jgi:hypothetical protein
LRCLFNVFFFFGHAAAAAAAAAVWDRQNSKVINKFNPHQSAPPQLFIYFRGCELAATPKNNIFAA